MSTVQLVKEQKMCCGCGICGAICPINAISMEISENGKSEPVISDACINCGKCLTTCPERNGETMASVEEGKHAFYCMCKSVRSKDSELLLNAASGGFVTTLVKKLLHDGIYDGAFLVDGYHYGRWIETSFHVAEDELYRSQKSRYVQVGHTKEMEYILANRDKRLILVGTPCYFKGFLKVVEEYRLNRENYLLVGLFCEKTMTTHVWEYFDEVFGEKQLKEMHFKSKIYGGWPGNIRLLLENGVEKEVSKRERMAVKDYFMPECCLDCVDKLNRYADFSVGDDYVTNYKEGSNSLIIRTERATEIWEKVCDLFVSQDCSFDDIAKSQHLELREKDLAVNRQKRLTKIDMGAARRYQEIYERILVERKRNSSLFRRILSKCKRMIKK